MDSHVLVAYATKHGATAEIAEKIGQVLAEEGLRVDVMPAGRAGDLAPYRAIVLGSTVYVGQWRKEAVRFLTANEKALAEKLVWLFSSGPTGENLPAVVPPGWKRPEKLRPITDRIEPRDITLFHGALNPGELNILEKWMIKAVKAPVGDFRNWDAITA